MLQIKLEENKNTLNKKIIVKKNLYIKDIRIFLEVNKPTLT